MKELSTEAFDKKWQAEAERGNCDSLGGMEYTRVKQEWIDAERPTNLVEFIVKRANITPC